MNTHNTNEDNSLQRFQLDYEYVRSFEEETANLVAENFRRGFETVVLQVNKYGLLPLMRFGKRVK